MGITYHAIAEYTALDDGVIDRVEYVWRDHWMLVGMWTSVFSHYVSSHGSVFLLVVGK